jgi:predicted chitinase
MNGPLQFDDLERFSKQAITFIDGLNGACMQYEINTPSRIAQFLAQLAHESADFYYTEEIASGAAYEGRADLGNTQPGDGVKYKGRGLIQITGRKNYQAVSMSLGVDFVNNPTKLADRPWSAESAGWYWNSRNLNALADQDSLDDFKEITRKINGGLNGLDSRISWWNKAKGIWPSTE